jgi:uncharacterized protein (DUF1501 family)
LSGGNDSNNTVVPNYDAGYAQYSAARAAQGLAIPRANLLPISPPAMNGDAYGLHPSMTDLHTLWNQGKLAVVTNVGTLMQPLTRAQYQSGASRPMQLFSHSDQVIVAPAPTPLNQVLALNGFTDTDATTRRNAMNAIRQADLEYSMTQAASVITQQAVNVSQQLSTDPVLTATFPNTTLGNQLRQVAKLMKFRTQLNMSRQVFYVQLGGFDTHSSQLSQHATLWTQVSQAMKAFYDETVAQGIAEDVTTFTMSDFNRTLNPAGSGSGAGSDHAWGGHHFVMGGSVLGGNFYGKPTANGSIFPTLVNAGPDDAETRGRIIPTVSVEQYAATLARWFGLSQTDIPLVFPNINAFGGSNLGFMM